MKYSQLAAQYNKNSLHDECPDFVCLKTLVVQAMFLRHVDYICQNLSIYFFYYWHNRLSSVMEQKEKPAKCKQIVAYRKTNTILLPFVSLPLNQIYLCYNGYHIFPGMFSHCNYHIGCLWISCFFRVMQAIMMVDDEEWKINWCSKIMEKQIYVPNTIILWALSILINSWSASIAVSMGFLLTAEVTPYPLMYRNLAARIVIHIKA